MKTTSAERALPAAQWVKFLERAGLLVDTPAKTTTAHAKAIAAGRYLAAKVGCAVPVCVKDRAGNERTGKATLQVEVVRANQKLYWFEVQWDAEATTGTADLPPPPPAPMSKEKAGEGQPRPAPAEPSKGAPALTGGNDEAW